MHVINIPDVSLTLCCYVVYSTRRFVLCLTLYYFVLVFFSPCSIAITSLGEERANLSAFPGVRLTFSCFVVNSTGRFVLCLTLCYFVLVFIIYM